ncbi:MAG: nucleotidyltransferase family protein [Prevotella sp.]|nr:nucleotidyltransferase family protein [Prevotella sp.]
MEDTYLEFLRYCIDDTLKLPVSVKDIDWMDLMDWAECQAIVGVFYQGIERGCKEQNNQEKLKIPFDDLAEWIGYAYDIKEQNKLVNKRCVEITSAFQKDGLETCILKGQGNAALYPNPLLRTSGDIDLFVTNKPVKEITRYVRGKNPEGKACYHHVHYGDYKDVEVEVHYRPSFANNLIMNRRLQRWFKGHGERCMIDLPEGAGSIPVPTREFNVVFQLSHIYRHVIQKGIGLRQMIDYYYLLRSANDKWRMEDGELKNTLKHLKLYNFARAVMWVLKEVLGMEEKYLIAPVDERKGRLLLEEIMEGGNFGKRHKSNAKWFNADTTIGRNILRLKRDIRLFRYFPSECLWEPIFRLWHFGWRKVHTY